MPSKVKKPVLDKHPKLHVRTGDKVIVRVMSIDSTRKRSAS